jgi:hypothetical protein
VDDDEVMRWLSDEERAAWSVLRREPGGDASWAIRSFRALAETRKALADLARIVDQRFILESISRDDAEKVAAAVAVADTMPRPR